MRKSLLGLILLLATAAHLSAALYYVDYASGSDANPGTSTWAPWKHCPGDPSASGLPGAQTLSPGDVVHFRGGVTYVFTSSTGIILKWNGSPGKPIVYTSGAQAGWGSGRARFTDNNGANAIAAFSSATLSRNVEFRALEFLRIGGAAALPADSGTPAAPRFGGGIAFAGGAENVTIIDSIFRELGYWSNQKPMGAQSLNGVGVSAKLARGLTITGCQFSRVAFAIDLSEATELSAVEIAKSTFQDAVIWPLRLPVGATAAAATSVGFVDCTTQPDTTFAAGAWSGYGHEPKAEVAAVTVGASATLYATATASPAPSFEWRRNGTPIAGQSGAMLRLSKVSFGDAGIYTAVASNAAGSASSNAAVLTVNPLPDGMVAPAILSQPVPQVMTAGGSARFEVVASGVPAPTYQWRRNGWPLAGQTGSALVLQNISAGEAGDYSVVVTNVAASITSSAASLVVSSASALAIAPYFKVQPINQVADVAGTATFSIVASGMPSPTIQWKKNGAAISGATSTTLTLPNVSSSDVGSYHATATNAAGSADSGTATLSLSPSANWPSTPPPPSTSTPPPTTATTTPVFTTQPLSVTANPLATTSFRAVASSSPEPTYQWRKNGVDIAGATAGTLSLPSITSNDTGTYTVVATNDAGSATSNPVTLTVLGPPVFIAQPASQTLDSSTTATFTATASGSPAPSYQWRRNGVNIAGATSATLTLPSITLWDAGSYSVLASNAAGEVSSDTAILTVVAPSSAAPALEPQPTTTTVKQLIFAESVLNGTPAQATFTIDSAESRKVLIRAVGPTLRTFGATDVLVDPVLELYRGQTLIQVNDNWKGLSTLSTAFAQAGTFPYASTISADSAMLVTLPPGTYDLRVYGIPSSVGMTLIEVYELP